MKRKFSNHVHKFLKHFKADVKINSNISVGVARKYIEKIMPGDRGFSNCYILGYYLRET